MEWYNSFAELLVSLFPLIIAVIVASCYIENDEKKSDGNNYHNIILPREDWSEEYARKFEEEIRRDRQTRKERRRKP